MVIFELDCPGLIVDYGYDVVSTTCLVGRNLSGYVKDNVSLLHITGVGRKYDGMTQPEIVRMTLRIGSDGERLVEVMDKGWERDVYRL